MLLFTWEVEARGVERAIMLKTLWSFILGKVLALFL